MSNPQFRFYVCRECGPKGLYKQLLAMKDQLAEEGIQVEVYHSICLSACRFNRVVKVQLPDGSLMSFSDQDQNGFRKWDSQPLVQLTRDCLPLEATV